MKIKDTSHLSFADIYSMLLYCKEQIKEWEDIIDDPNPEASKQDQKDNMDAVYEYEEMAERLDDILADRLHDIFP